MYCLLVDGIQKSEVLLRNEFYQTHTRSMHSTAVRCEQSLRRVWCASLHHLSLLLVNIILNVTNRLLYEEDQLNFLLLIIRRAAAYSLLHHISHDVGVKITSMSSLIGYLLLSLISLDLVRSIFLCVGVHKKRCYSLGNLRVVFNFRFWLCICYMLYVIVSEFPYVRVGLKFYTQNSEWLARNSSGKSFLHFAKTLHCDKFPLET